MKENIKAPRHWPLCLCGEVIGDRPVNSRTNGQWRGKCFHLMTSSWWNIDAVCVSDRNYGINWRTGYRGFSQIHYNEVIMTTMASQITSLTVVYSTVYSDADPRKHRSSASLAFVWGTHRDRWIPRTKGQLRGKCFHLMKSSCLKENMFSSITQSGATSIHTYTNMLA